MNALVDNTGAAVTVRLDTGHPISSYTVRVADGGAVREPTAADVALVAHATRNGE